VERLMVDIDRSGDTLSTDELRIFAGMVFNATELLHDARRLDLVVDDVTFPNVDALRRGEGTIRLQATAVLPAQSNGSHRISFRNGYRRDVSVYLANALVPESSRVAVTAQRHAHDQHELTIDYVLRDRRSMSAWILGSVLVALTAVLLSGRPEQ